MLGQNAYSQEELSLLNPAFVGYILYSSVREHVAFEKAGMHCALPFIVVPMSMCKEVSRNLPSTFKTPIASWVASNEGPLTYLYDQVESYNGVVQSALSYLLDRRLLSLTSDGHLLLGNDCLVRSSVLFKKSEDMKGVLRASKFIGKWFSHAPSVETVFAQLGLRP